MHGVFTHVTVKDADAARSALREQVVPGVKQAPGFVTGYWTLKDNSGLSCVIFDSEDAARAASERIPSMVPESVTVDDIEVREVVAHA